MIQRDIERFLDEESTIQAEMYEKAMVKHLFSVKGKFVTLLI